MLMLKAVDKAAAIPEKFSSGNIGVFIGRKALPRDKEGASGCGIALGLEKSLHLPLWLSVCNQWSWWRSRRLTREGGVVRLEQIHMEDIVDLEMGGELKPVSEWGNDLDDGKGSNEGRRKLVGTCKTKVLGGEEHLISQAVQHRSSVLICLSLHVHLCFGQSSLGCGQTLLQSGDETKSCREGAAKAKGKRKSWRSSHR